MKRVAVITGGSSGIGLAAAKLLSENAYSVYEISRSGSSTSAITHITADVCDEEQLEAAFKAVFAAEGRIDLLVNNAGMGISGAVEYTELSDAKRIFDVNFFGVFLSSRECIKYLRQTPGSQIINISSVAAAFPIPYQSFYSATKSAQNSLTLALSSELRSFGIRANGIMPGDVRTGFTEARLKSNAGSEVYGDSIRAAVGNMENDEKSGMNPEAVARVILKVSQKNCTGRVFTAGGKYKMFIFLSKFLPVGLVTRAVASMYR